MLIPARVDASEESKEVSTATKQNPFPGVNPWIQGVWSDDPFRHYPHNHGGGDGPYRGIRSGIIDSLNLTKITHWNSII